MLEKRSIARKILRQSLINYVIGECFFSVINSVSKDVLFNLKSPFDSTS